MNHHGPKSEEMASPTGSDSDSAFSTGDKKKKKIIPKIFNPKKKTSASDDDGYEADLDKHLSVKIPSLTEVSPVIRKSLSGGLLPSSSQERYGTSARIESLNLSNLEHLTGPSIERHTFRISVTTWNVGGRTPTPNLNLEDLLQVEKPSDIYVIGFQEIVPLNAGNVLVIEDNEPAAKWIALINEALNTPHHETSLNSPSDSSHGSKQSKSKFFQKPNLKVLSRSLKVDSSLLKTCNCYLYPSTADDWKPRAHLDTYIPLNTSEQYEDDDYLSIQGIPSSTEPLSSTFQAKYRLVACKQMVGIFLSVWTRHQLIPHIGHLRICKVGRGIMCRLGNKGCICVSMTLHKTSFCFVCSHLASGEKEGDELRRNADVAEILKSTQFANMCKNSKHPAPERIIDHDRILWFGDLNYRVSLSFEEATALLEGNNRDFLLGKDQLMIEREGGRVFNGWKEGKILFAPTYKYCRDSDSYTGENVKSKKKRRTPAWCDRILWHGEGMQQVSYTRVESRFSDHRPVCAIFCVEAETEMRGKGSNKFRKGYSYMGRRQNYDVCLPQQYRLDDF